MKITDLVLEGLKQLELRIFRDERGFFTERYNRETFGKLGIHSEFLQDNHSRSLPGVIRGLHYQTSPAQAKLVGVLRGRIWDVAVDLRRDSPTYGKHVGVELSDTNGKLLWIPAGFAHGFCVIGSEPADVMYKVDGLYSPATEGGIRWSDPELKIQWPLPPEQKPIVNAKDDALPSFSDYRLNPKF